MFSDMGVYEDAEGTVGKKRGLKKRIKSTLFSNNFLSVKRIFLMVPANS